MKYKDYEGPVEPLVSEELNRIEEVHQVRIIHSIESGSRAWGFASPDSDYDVRFIYVRTADSYLSLAPHKDHIDGILDDTLDINGWDLSKIFQQIHRSNPNIYEWLNSPVVYRTTADVMGKVREIADLYYSAKPFLYHYYGTAKNNFEQYLKQEQVRYKKYFYVLRPLLACAWIEQRNCPPPVLFDKLLDSLANESLRHEIEKLRAQKTQMNESETGPVIPSVHAYIEERLAYYSDYIRSLPDERHADWKAIDDVFREIILR